MRLAVIRADGVTVWTERDTAPDLADLQALVGGYIERVPMPEGWGPGVMYVDEEGLCKNAKFNRVATLLMRNAWEDYCHREGLDPAMELDYSRVYLVGDAVWVDQ